jgi:hypothetical protein
MQCRERQKGAINGREQAQHMLCDDLVARARSTWCTITRRAIQHRRAPISR